MPLTRWLPWVLFGLAISATGMGDAAAEPCTPVVGRLASVEGEIEVRRADARRWQPAGLDEAVCEGDAIRAGRHSRAAIALINDAVLRLDQNTTLQLTDITAQEQERSFFDLIVGAIQSFSRAPRLLAVNTPYLNATVEGTEFYIEVAENQSAIVIMEGVVRAANDFGEVRVGSGEAAAAEAGQPPQARTVVRPRDAVQWALYYPPVLAARGTPAAALPPDLPPALVQALGLAARGETRAAFAALERVPAAERDARYHLYRASILLSVGRIEDARAALERTLAMDPEAGLAYALRAIINVVQNQRDQALADAERAVALSPTASAPKIALSYAHQANFELAAARDVMLQAVEQNPDDALARARLAELWASLGRRDRARAAAEEAVALAPDLERTQVVLGFANLVEFRTAAAKDAFRRAIELDPADPLAHLGLGLARIREGDLEQGRESIEVAVALDSNRSILRSYLGKAYFEEKRIAIANEQYALAEELDPLDPTPHLYAAIKEQTENRPVEALDELETSIELNDNRAVYRSRLQLDADRAARGTSLARVYSDLGFDELGLRQSSRSLTLDPTNASAHRFLSDTYRGIRRREIARVSELLQAQMLQDININPVQPSISETNLNIVTQGGPAEAGFNEFTPLFERRQAQLNATGVAGDDDTYGGEGVVSMLYDRFSLSAGGFHFETDGWRENHVINHDIYNAFFQAAITPELNAQVELRHRDTEEGDLALNFDPDDFSSTQERELNQDTGRLGLRYAPAPHSDVLFSFIYSDREEGVFDQFDSLIGPIETRGESDDEGFQTEAQYLYRQERFNLVAGGSFSDFERDVAAFASIGGFPVLDLTRKEDITHVHPYAYGNLNLPQPVTWTVGLSFDDFKQEELSVEEFNPKFGAQWQASDALRLRAAAFRTVKPLLANNQSLEPTQVAGFNQLFDDTNASAAWRVGAGFDLKITERLLVGAEGTWREIDFPSLDTDAGVAIFTDHQEQTHRAYAYFAPLDEVVMSAEFVYDRFEAERSFLTIEDVFPEKLETYSVPVVVRYFDPRGFFASFGATYVNQRVDRTPGAELGLAEGHEDFFVLDAAVGYRLPKRFGLISLEVSNLLDEDFRFQDDSFREFDDAPSIGPYIPDRQVLGRVTLNW